MIDKTHKSNMKDTKTQSGVDPAFSTPSIGMQNEETAWVTHIEPLQLDKKLCFECQTVKDRNTKIRALNRKILKLNKELEDKQHITIKALTLEQIKQAAIEIRKRDNVTLQSSKDDKETLPDG